MLPDPARLAVLHATSFPTAWDEAAFAALLAQPGVFALCEEAGFILCRIAADEAEILTFCVHPAKRRQGIAGRLVRQAMAEALKKGAQAMFLEVAAQNEAGLSLYRGMGFTQAGIRKAYYAQTRQDALVMRAELR